MRLALSHVGKQVLLHGQHFADAATPEAAEAITALRFVPGLIDALRQCAEYLDRFAGLGDDGGRQVPNEAARLLGTVQAAISSMEGRADG